MWAPSTAAPRSFRTHGAGWLTKLIGLLQTLVLIALAACVLWLIISFPLWWGDAPRLALPLAVGITPAADLVTYADTADSLQHRELSRVRGDLTVKFANPWTQWIYIFCAVLEILLVFMITGILRRIVGSIAKGQAFSGMNARRLRWLGLLFITESVYGTGVSALLTSRVIKGMELNGGQLHVDWTSEVGQASFITGWIILVLSEVFRQGAELQTDQSLTV